MLTLVGGFVAGCVDDSRTDTTRSRTTGASDASTAALHRLFSASAEAEVRRNPLLAIVRGDARFSGTFGEYLSPRYFDAERAAADSDLQALASIDSGRLSEADRVSYEAFAWQRRLVREGYASALLAVSSVLPTDHYAGLHVYFADLSSGHGAAPFNTLTDFQAGLERLHGFANELDTMRVRFADGLATGRLQSRVETQKLIVQLDAFISHGVDGSPLLAPTRDMPMDIPAVDQMQIRRRYQDVIGNEILPAFVRLRGYLRHEYLPHARRSIGLSAMRGGAALYRHLVALHTTTSLSPDSIRRIGLAEVARIRAAMDVVRVEVRFARTLEEFLDHVRTAREFQPSSAEWLMQEYEGIGARVQTKLPMLFHRMPRTPIEIREVPSYLEKTQSSGYYRSGSPDGSRAGVFFVNTSELPSRNTTGMETLYLHEAVPGHHLQLSLTQEDDRLPAFQRFGANTAFVEGWALYAEQLGPELGLLVDPYQRLGSLNDEMLRAMRLVVDVGIHADGWSRDKAIRYMLKNSSMGRSDVETEVDRYIAVPGQALGYKIGQLTISRLRHRAEQQLGAQFDVRDFHDQVLGSGAIPLDVLERKIARWIGAEGERRRPGARANRDSR